MLGVEQFAAIGVAFTVALTTLMVLAILYMVKEIVKEKVDWWHRKWRMEGKLEELERRVSVLEEGRDLSGEGESI